MDSDRKSHFPLFSMFSIQGKLPMIFFVLQIGDRVCVKRSVAEPRYAWGGETHHSVGRISEIENDGLLIIVLAIDQFHGRLIHRTWKRLRISR